MSSSYLTPLFFFTLLKKIFDLILKVPGTFFYIKALWSFPKHDYFLWISFFMLKIMIYLTNFNMCGVIEFLIEKKKNDWTDLLCTDSDNYYSHPPLPKNTRNLSQTCFPDQSDMGLHWKHMGFCHQGPVWHLLLLNILRSFQVSFALPNATFHLSIDGPISSFRLLWHILSFICLCYLKKKKREREGERTHQRRMAKQS